MGKDIEKVSEGAIHNANDYNITKDTTEECTTIDAKCETSKQTAEMSDVIQQDDLDVSLDHPEQKSNLNEDGSAIENENDQIMNLALEKQKGISDLIAPLALS